MNDTIVTRPGRYYPGIALWKAYALLFITIFVGCLAAIASYNKFFAEEEETSCLQLPGPAHEAPVPPALRRNPDAKGPGVVRPE